MARPTKSVLTMSKNLTNEERKARLENENRLKGRVNKIVPPQHLSLEQIKIFKYIVKELKASQILGNLDIYILSICSIAIDRLKNIEILINDNFKLVMDKELMAAKDKYTKDLFRCTNELSLSPQSRAKLGNLNLNDKANKEDKLLKIITGRK